MLITLPVSLQLIRQVLITNLGLGPAKCTYGNEGRVNPNWLCMGVLSEGREGDLGEIWGFGAVQEAGKCCSHDPPGMLSMEFPVWEHFPSSAPAIAGPIPGQHLVKCWDGSCSGNHFLMGMVMETKALRE